MNRVKITKKQEEKKEKKRGKKPPQLVSSLTRKDKDGRKASKKLGDETKTLNPKFSQSRQALSLP